MIFGGYVLRLTFELAQLCATRFAHAEAQFISLDQATFERPVPVGATLDYEAMVVYILPSSDASSLFLASKSRIQIRVKTSVTEMNTGSRIYTGTFAYTFEVEGKRILLPTTYEEYMEWINARR